MKKSLLLVLVLTIALTVLAGCGKKEDPTTTAPATTAPATTAPATTAPATTAPATTAPIDTVPSITDGFADVKVTKGSQEVTMTFPATFWGDADSKKIAMATAQADGIKVKENADGSVTHTMTRAEYDGLMKEIVDSLKEMFDEMVKNPDLKVFKSITANSNYTDIKIVVNKAAYEEIKPFFSLYMIGISIGVEAYHIYDGTSGIITTITISDEAGNKLDTIKYPEK